MATPTPEGGATPRPPVVTPTDEWLARISAQLDDLATVLKPPNVSRKPSPVKRAEVTGD